MKRLIVTPAYGREYKTKKAAIADWNADKDFIIATFMGPYGGKPINKQAADQGQIEVQIRFDRNRKFAIVPPAKG